jgi:hypothetical protein
MFRKLVSNLPFSPALVGQLSFYARRLRKEEFTRRLGLIFTVLALIMQSFAVFSPPEQALASGNADIVRGGVSSVDKILEVYDAGAQGQNDFKDLMDYFGVTREELVAMNRKVVYICSSDHNITSFGRQHHYSAAEGELVNNVPRQTGGFSTFYSVPLFRFDSVNHSVNCYDSYVGNSQKLGWFGIMRKCGNFQIKNKTQKLPRGHFVAVSCSAVKGYAYDERQLDLKVKVYLYFGGQPGKGKQFGPIMAEQAEPSADIGPGYGFSFNVPAEYQRLASATPVWAVMQPLPGWEQPTVQFENALEVPSDCNIPTKTPASCSGLAVGYIDRTHIKLTAQAVADKDVIISSYMFVVTDNSGKKVYEKIINTSNQLASIENIDLASPGEYTTKVVVKTSVGSFESADCNKPITISPIQKCKFSSSILETDENCKPCPYDKTIWLKDEASCRTQISESKEAKNLSQNISNANGTTAKAADRIEFTIYTTNIGSGTVGANIQESIGDVLEYAKLLDSGGGTFNDSEKTLKWGNVQIGPQQTDIRKFVVQVKDVIPSTPRAANDPAAYNCLMTNSYGNTIDIHVDCPVEKAIEGAVHILPSTGPGENVLFGLVLIMVVTYFYARSRQLSKEVRLIKKEFNSGTI